MKSFGSIISQALEEKKQKVIDTGADPIKGGKFKMYPSGDIVDFEERNRRLKPVKMGGDRSNLIFGRTSRQINAMQGRNKDLKKK